MTCSSHGMQISMVSKILRSLEVQDREQILKEPKIAPASILAVSLVAMKADLNIP